MSYTTILHRHVSITYHSMQDPKVDYWMFMRYILIFLTANLCWASTVYRYNY